MKKLLLVPLLGLFVACEANSVINKTVGEEVVLHPGPVTGPITVITWKHNRNIITYWFGNKTVFHEPFTGRCKLNTTTGELIISNLTLNDSGSYTAEIYNKSLKPIELSVISAENQGSSNSSKDVSSTNSSTTGNNNNGLYGLLILLVVPVVGVFIYKRKHRTVSFTPQLPTHSCFTTKAGAAEPTVVFIHNEPETVNDLLIGENNNTVILQQIDSAPLQQ